MPRQIASRSAKRARNTVPAKNKGASSQSRQIDKKSEEVLRRVRSYIKTNQSIFARHGAIVTTWRLYRGHRLGPYFRLAFRKEGVQRSLYLGDNPAATEEIRELLQKLQSPLRERRLAARRLVEERRVARQRKKRLIESELAKAKKSVPKKPLAKKPPATKKSAVKKSSAKKRSGR
jgi:hypothetical protein